METGEGQPFCGEVQVEQHALNVRYRYRKFLYLIPDQVRYTEFFRIFLW